MPKKKNRPQRNTGRPADAAEHVPPPQAAVETRHADGERLDESRREDIRGVMIAVVNGHLLLPNASIAEVLSYADPEPIDNTPDWLLGRIRWRGWQLPMVAFSKLAGLGGEQAQLGNKVIVLRALGGNPKFPYFAMLIQGFPRLVTVTHDGLRGSDIDEPLPEAVLARVVHNEDEALLPDILRLETRIGEALAEAA